LARAVTRRVIRTAVTTPEGLLLFDDITVGMVLKSDTPYLFTAEEIKEVAERWDPMPFHLDEAAGAASLFGGLVASGGHTVIVSIKLGAEEMPRTAAVAGLGIDELRFLAPVRPGDRLTQTTEVVDVRPSGSQPDRGIVRGRRSVRNQDGVEVMTYVVGWMVARAV
jgi:acyl dehydratase